MSAIHTRVQRGWVYPVVVLSGLAIAAFGILYALDRYAQGVGGPLGFFSFRAEQIVDSVGSLSSIIAAVLGIIITVVSIIVQLSAERYAGVTEMFFRDRTNLAIMAFYIVGCVCGLFVSFSLGERGFVPRITLTVTMAIAVLGFALMAPYFAYVFDFLKPENIIIRIQTNSLTAAQRGTRTNRPEVRAAHQAACLAGLEQLTDITINSISSKDKIIATAGVHALKDLAVRYIELKRESRPEWFAIGPGIRANPDFVSMTPDSVSDLTERRTWLEFKVLRQYQAVYGEALTSMRDINYVIAIDTRYLGEAAIRAGHTHVLALSIKFFNTYLRATLNAGDVRTAYNILNQYRQLAETLIRVGWHAKATEVAEYLKYYAHESLKLGLDFVTETIAYDMCALCEVAHALQSPVQEQLLDTFLDVDQPELPEAGDAPDRGLRGVRKAQVKLATYYLTHGAEPLARRIWEDMKHEQPERLLAICDQLAAVVEKDFWEIIDRGMNFDYLPPEQRVALRTFSDWMSIHTANEAH